ncbi:RNA polymerase sigma-F factor [Mycobacteroides abscessus subsp. abscessus]|nr:RNA polymerase sigma-F factor [Mycobacteroides abscessus subsp. abscessus]
MECPVDVPETGHSQVKPRVGRATDDYADVPDMFRSLAAESVNLFEAPSSGIY